MAVTTVNGLEIAYDIIGDGAQTWAITPGGRFSKDYGGVRELAEGLAATGRRVLIWDRPNCGASSVSFTGPTESALQADTLAALIRQLGLGPAVIAGGSGGSRVSLLTVARNPDIATGLAMWWISGGVFGRRHLGSDDRLRQRCERSRASPGHVRGGGGPDPGRTPAGTALGRPGVDRARRAAGRPGRVALQELAAPGSAAGRLWPADPLTRAV